MYPVDYVIEWPMNYYLEYLVVEYLTEDRLCNNCSLWVWDAHEENTDPKRIALQLSYRIAPLYTLKSSSTP